MPTLNDKLDLKHFALQAGGGVCISASMTYITGKKENAKPNTSYELDVQWNGKNRELIVTVNPFPLEEKIVYGLAGRMYILAQDGAVHIYDLGGNPIKTLEVANRIGVALMDRMPRLKGELVDPVIKAIFEGYHDRSLMLAGQPDNESVEAIVGMHDYAIINGIYAERCSDNFERGKMIIPCFGIGTRRLIGGL